MPDTASPLTAPALPLAFSIDGSPWAATDAFYTPAEFRVHWSTCPWDLAQARRLRREVFCAEQGVFSGNDLDAIDALPTTHTLVASGCVAGMDDQVVGTVRIHPQTAVGEDGVWWGSRLAVDPRFRNHRGLGSSLIRLAVSSAVARGCRVFLAHVQAQNEPLFQRLGWTRLREQTLHGRAHVLMQADLAQYPPCFDPYWGFAVPASRRRA